MQLSETLIQQLDWIQDIPKGTGPNKAICLPFIGHVLGICSHQICKVRTAQHAPSPAPPRPTPHCIMGIGGAISDIKVGMVRWKIEDDQGRVHMIELLNTFYIPSSPSSLLLPQHWALVTKDNYPKKGGTHCVTYDHSVILQ